MVSCWQLSICWVISDIFDILIQFVCHLLSKKKNVMSVNFICFRCSVCLVHSPGEQMCLHLLPSELRELLIYNLVSWKHAYGDYIIFLYTFCVCFLENFDRSVNQMRSL